MNSSEEFWSVDDVSLHQYGWSVTTVGGSRYDLPPRRGSNFAIAGRPGQVHRRKLPDQRTITVVMWMVGWDPSTGPAIGSVPNTGDQRVQWNDNWDFLRRLVYKAYLTDGRVTLTRRWRLTAPNFKSTRTDDDGNPAEIVIAGDPGTSTPGVSRIVTASQYAEMSSTMAPTMTGRTRSDFQMDFTLADPFFYGPAVTTTHNRSSAGFYVWNDGHDVAAHAGLTVEFIGPLKDPILTNVTTNPDSWVRYFGTIDAGKSVTLNVGRYLVYEHPTGATTPQVNKIAGITSSGPEFWVNVLPGANKFVFAASGAAAGQCKLTFQPPYV